MDKMAEENLSGPIPHGFKFDNGTFLTPDEMKIVEGYGFSFSNGMLLTPNEIEVMKNFRFTIHH
jgi:hypothetical protein